MGHTIHTESLILVEIFSFLVAILVLVTIHEWGHYWVARRCGVAIEKFSIGFGKTIFSWTNREGTEFCLAMIPLGGYVKMRGEYAIATSEAQTQAEKGSFAACSVWQRMAIVAAGPVVNLLFAALIFAYFSYGTAFSAVVAKPAEPSIFAAMGIQDGDTITHFNQKRIHSYGDIQIPLIKALLSKKSIEVKWTDGQGVAHTGVVQDLSTVNLEATDVAQKTSLQLYLPTLSIEQVQADTPAEKAGLKAGDELIGVNGHKASGNTVLDTINASANQTVTLMVQRNAEQFSLDVVPTSVALLATQPGQAAPQEGRIGVVTGRKNLSMTEPRGFFKSAYLGVNATIEQAGLNVQFLYKMLQGHLSLKNLGGPVTIAKQAGNSAHAGFTQFLGFLAVLSVSLGTLNLLPIPVLDGGHLVYYAAEVLRGKPLPEKILIIGQKIGLILLLMLMGIALLNDMRWFT